MAQKKRPTKNPMAAQRASMRDVYGKKKPAKKPAAKK